MRPAAFTLCMYIALAPPFALAKSAAEATIGFGTAEATRAEVTDPRTGTRYIVELDVDPDVNGKARLVYLVLHRPGSEENLLDPFGPFHGLQPYMFAALDVSHGPDRTAFGRTRRMPIRRTETHLIVRIDEASSRMLSQPGGNDPSSGEVTRLRVHIALTARP
jgi:hypothetical protein